MPVRFAGTAIAKPSPMDDLRSTVQQAVVLAAGNGDRFHDQSQHSKLLASVAGVPLLIRTLESAARAGVRDAYLVLGYDADSVRELATSRAPSALRLHFRMNHEWGLENGVSVLAARAAVGERPFALMMGDHIFEPQLLRRLLAEPPLPDEVLLGVDRQPCDAETAAEATKVRLRGDRICAIGKLLEPYDALDTGLFVCQPSIFAALDEACSAGDSTLSGGIGRLADRGLVRGVDIGDARWCDIDTIADLLSAERIVQHASRQ
jgi:1L-myo-inositol 1-phosphate cytidylyltransferase